MEYSPANLFGELPFAPKAREEEKVTLFTILGGNRPAERRGECLVILRFCKGVFRQRVIKELLIFGFGLHTLEVRVYKPPYPWTKLPPRIMYENIRINKNTKSLDQYWNSGLSKHGDFKRDLRNLTHCYASVYTMNAEDSEFVARIIGRHAPIGNREVVTRMLDKLWSDRDHRRRIESVIHRVPKVYWYDSWMDDLLCNENIIAFERLPD